MAKTVQPIAIELGIKGEEKLAALSRSFRDLSKQVKFSDADIIQATRDVAKFAQEAGNSEATIKGHINALKGLQSQAGLSSNQYKALGRDIKGLELTLNGTTEEIEAQRKAVIGKATAIGKTSRAVSSYIKQLKNLQGQTREGSKAFKDIASDVDTLSVKLDQLKAKDLQNLKVGFQGVKGAAVSAVRGAVSEFNKLAIESKAAIAGVAGLGAAGAAGAVLGPIGSIPAALSSSLGSGANVLSGLKSTLGDLPFGFGKLGQIVSPEAVANLQQASDKFAGMQSELIKLDQVFDTINSTVTAFGPGATAAATAATVGIAVIYDKLKKKSDEAKKDLEKTFKPIGDDVQVLIEKLQRLGNSLSDLSTSRINELLALARRDFDFAPAGSPLSRAAASRLAGLESVGRDEAQAQADVLEEYRQRVRGTEQSVDRLNERLSYLREGLKTVDVSTKEGAATYVNAQREIKALEGALEKIANSYRTVGDAARQANTAIGGGATNPFGVSGGRNPAYSREKEAQELERLIQLEKELNRLVDEYNESNIRALQTIEGYQQKRHDEFMSQIAKEDEAQQKAFAEQVAREEEAFKQELRRRDVLLQAQKAAASALGLGGREDISSLYQGIIGLSTADIRRQQQMMGKSATEVFNDIATAFSKGGQAVDLKAKSTDIGDSIAEGISKGASDSDDINKGAKTFAERLIAAYKRVFAIRSPSKETEQKIGIPLGLGIIRGLIKGLKEGKREVQQEIESIADPVIGRSRQPRRLIGTVNQPIATFTGYGTVARPATPGYRPLGQAVGEINRETDQMFDRFRAGIAALTTDTEIYYNLLKRLPTSRITTDLADLASKRARASEVSGFIENQRLIGPGELEREIASSVAQYLKDLRTPNPWVGIAGDYKQFINSISTETKRLRSSIPALPPGKVAGLLPPAIEGLTPYQQMRYEQARVKSDERSARISAEDALRGRALPPGRAGGELALISQFIGGGSGGGGKTGIAGGAGGAAAEYMKLNKELKGFEPLSNRATAEIRELSASLNLLQETLSPLDADFDKVNKAIDKQSRLIDKELEKRDRRRRRGRGFSAGQLAQAAGATISGGIFGGPEGFLGGAIGTAFGGPGGAFAGAAIGAQVGGLRRELGGYAEYAAQIEKLKVALKGLTKDQSEFNYALAASQKVTQDFNVPQQESIRGITRLAAAIKGAGGPLTDAEVVFRNITTAIKATGGSAQDVEGAVTAMVQVFSKGKVSAEELSGQLGERLPGAVTMFAKANNMSLVELQDNLKAGTVGLNELMKFVRSLGDTYGATARKISDSNADAGARLQVVVNDMKAAIGDALIPIGAQLQDAFAEFLKEITPTLVEVLPKIGELFLGIVENLDLIAQAAAAVFAVVLVGKITAIVASIGSLSAAIFTLKLNAIVATKALIGLNAAALLNPYVALAAGAAALGVAIYRAAQEQKRLNTLIREGSVADIDKQIAENRSEIIKIEQRQLNPGPFYDGTGGPQGTSLSPRQRDIQNIERYTDANKKLLEARKRAVYDATQGADLPENLLRPFDYQSPKGDGGDGKGGSSAKEKRERKSQLESIRNGEKLLDIELMLLENSREIGRAQFENNFARVNDLNNQKISLEFAKQAAQNEFEYRDAVAQAIGDENQAAIIQEAALKREIQDKLLLIQYEGALSDEAQRRALEQKAAAKASQDELFSLREKLGLVSDQERISRYRTNLEEQGTPNADELTDLYRQTIDPTFAEGISQNIRALKQELEELLDPINQVTGAANTIGTAFTDSFMSAITGSATAQEALANFFSNTAKYFLDMAAQIIQKMITMAILNQVVGLLPGGGGFKFSGGSADAGLNAANLMGGITPFAMGGIVDKPTMFAYANGGVGRFGIMGEAGPEAILPLQRGPGGKLGVQASGSSVGDVVVNVDASGTRAQGDNQSASQLGNVIGAAVQAELIKQKRPGGLLA